MTRDSADAVEVTRDWRRIAKLAGEHGIRYRTNAALEKFLSALSATPSTSEPVAYLHTLHMEGGQTHTRLSEDDGTDEYEPSRTAFGKPGRDYSEEYRVTTTPLFATPSPSEAMVERLREAIMEIVSATRAYLPPDGISAQECLNRIIGATDNATINPIIAEMEA